MKDKKIVKCVTFSKELWDNNPMINFISSEDFEDTVYSIYFDGTFAVNNTEENSVYFFERLNLALKDVEIDYKDCNIELENLLGELYV